MGVKLVSSGGGSVEINPPATASNFVATMPAGTGTVAVNGVSSNLVLGTAVASTSGTSIDFTGIPSWVRRVTVMFQGVSLSSTQNILIQVGAGTTPATTGYNSAAVSVSNAASNTTNGSAVITNGFNCAGFTSTAASTASGNYVITNINGNAWTGSGLFWVSGANRVAIFAGDVTLSGVLGMVRITTTGADTFDAGSINIMYE